MATRDIDPFEIGRRGLAIPFREFPIWLACAVWPFAFAVGTAYARRHAIDVPPLVRTPARWLADAIFDWCWMTALCRSTLLHLLTFPARRGFWLFLVVTLGLSAFSTALAAMLGTLVTAAMWGGIFFLDVSGPLVQIAGVVGAPLLFLAGVWIGLRLMIWPAHCAATGRLAGPRTIWRGMQDHSFDALIIGLVTVGPSLLLALGWFILARGTGLLDHASADLMSAVSLAVNTYSTGAFDAAMLIAYYGIFAPKEM
ncbi:MAG TPA: hypothetical protein VHA35_12875 [Dongiaceae bacterium]|nr:hypothetical protein [Dongiaceae bacterium]